MTISITQNFNNCHGLTISHPPKSKRFLNKDNKQQITDQTANVNLAVAEGKKGQKVSFKQMIVIAAWIVSFIAGLSLAIFGAVTANSCMSQLGSLLVMGLAGSGVKVFEFALSHKG